MPSAGSKGSTLGTEVPAVREGEAGLQTTLVYDAGCYSCARFARLVRRLDRKKRIEFASMYDPAVEARMRPKLGDAYDRSFHLELPGGEVKSGEDALQDLARLLPATAPLGAVAFRLPGVRDVPAMLYRAFAAGRTCAADTAGKISKD
jgi:predicted DCC family thiol-disulfide oxidoreductase YuxK